MARQIDTCKQISSRLLAFTGHERAEGGGKMAADQFVARIVEKSDERHLKIRLYDYGPVSSVSADDPAGTPLFSSRLPPESKHFDLLMAKAAIDRCGGKIDSRLHGEGSLCMELTLRLSGPKTPTGTHGSS